MASAAPIAPLGLPVAVAVLAGAAGVALLASLPSPVVLIALALAGVTLVARDDAWRLVGALLIGVVLAACAGHWRLAHRLPGSLARQDMVVVGQVRGLPERDAHSVRFDFDVDASDRAGLAGRRLRIGWFGTAVTPAPGSAWRLRVRVRPPHGVAGPGGFDSEKQALVDGIDGLGYVRGEARRLAPGGGIDAFRDRLSAASAAAMPPGRARVVEALALGDTRWRGTADWDVLRATGLTHLIAISGFHVGMVGGFGALLVLGLYRVVPTLGRRWPRPQAAACAALVFAAAYTALAGFALPTMRTLLMIAAVLLGRALRRGQSGADAFALALLAVLACDPLAVLAPGFWLSFLGVGWLLWCLPGEPGAGRVRPFLAAQAVALVGLLPLGVGFFGQASLPSPLTNLVAIPVISLGVVPLALAGTLALAIPGPFGSVLLRLAGGLMDLLWDAMCRIAASPVGSVALPEAGLAAVALACVGAFWLLLPRGTPARWLGALLFLPLLWPARALPAAEVAEVTVLDVGQGLSVLVRTRSHALLFDAGPANARGLDYGASVVVPALRALGVRRLDAISASHADNDHAGGLAAVRAAFPAARVLAPAGSGIPEAAACLRDDAWHWDGVDLRVLHPPPLMPYARNDSSCVLRIEAGGHAALLPGDIGRHVEHRLVREQPAALRADLLLVPHHGSDTSSSAAFVARVAPRWAVVASGADNRFALPRADALARYRAQGATILGTAGHGALVFRLDARGARPLRRWRQDRPRWWRERRRFVDGP
jgi:competence protein ComEC